ncbi:lysostaphin resistance A-like protein [Bacteroidota bacterium]
MLSNQQVEKQMEQNSIIESKIKPISWGPTLIILICVSMMFYFTHYHFVPHFADETGKPYLIGYLIGWITTVSVIFVVSIVAYRIEGNKVSSKEFAKRFRLKKMDTKDWLWTTLLLVVVLVSYLGLTPVSKWLATIGVFAPHPDFPSDLSPEGLNNLQPGLLFGMNLKGKWWIVGVYFVGWVINIIGEEFFYRGWLLPRQELAFGNSAWIINGTMFTLQHWMQPWNFLAILPGALLMVYIVQIRKNTWIAIIQHGVVNLGLLLHIIRGVLM